MQYIYIIYLFQNTIVKEVSTQQQTKHIAAVPKTIEIPKKDSILVPYVNRM